MNSELMLKLKEVLRTIDTKPENAWLYLPSEGVWTLDSNSAVLESDEVPPELEDEPDAGVPDFAKRNGLRQVLPVTTVQDIIANARTQRPNATLEEILEAFEFYHDNDACIEF
jgi:hypothetical protein